MIIWLLWVARDLGDHSYIFIEVTWTVSIKFRDGVKEIMIMGRWLLMSLINLYSF